MAFIDCIAEQELRELFELWRAARLRGVARREDLSLEQLSPTILPYVFIYELIGDRFRCRLAGTRLADAFGYDATGRFLDEMVRPDRLASRIALFRQVHEDGYPLYYQGWVAEATREWRFFSRLLLPVEHRSGARHILGAVLFPAAPSDRSKIGGDIIQVHQATDTDIPTG